MIENNASSLFLLNQLGDLHFEYGGLENLPEVMAVMEHSFSKTYGESWNNNQCRSMLCLPGTRLLLTRIDGDLSGFAISRAIASEEELLMIAVTPEYRKIGIATALLQQITLRARKENVEVIFLEVRSDNPAQSLYQQLGFEKIGVRAAYYTGSDEAKYDANTFRKLLKNNN